MVSRNQRTIAAALIVLAALILLYSSKNALISHLHDHKSGAPKATTASAVDLKQQDPVAKTMCTFAKPITPIRTRRELHVILNEEQFKVGAELGVQRGEYSQYILSNWRFGTRYYLIDLWKQQENYHDVANVDNAAQEGLYKTTVDKLKEFKDKTVFIRDFTSNAVKKIADGELDFVYVDARHDYCGCLEDIELYWPKLRAGGIMFGHDYKLANEVEGQDWSVCMDGTKKEGAVRGAVDDFAAKHNLQVIVTYRDDWNTWMFRKPLQISA